MRKMTAEALIASLQKEGLSFSSSTMVHEGEYHPSDADWNYKDIPHLNELHNQVEGIATAVGDDIITTVFMQRLGPLRIPLTVVNYAVDRNSQMYYTTVGPFCLVIKTEWVSINSSHTRVETCYNLGSLKVFRFLHRIIHKLLSKNYQILMSEDVPMRERRGLLRANGFSFTRDLIGYSFIDTLNTSKKNLIYPSSSQPFSLSVSVSQLPVGRSLIGSNTDNGLRIERTQDSLLIFDRLCAHEGASLDESDLERGCLRCPWHGRTIHPLAVFELSENQQRSGLIKIDFHNGELSAQISED